MTSSLESVLHKSRSHFHSVVPFDHQKDRLVKLDLGAANPDLDEAVFGDIALFSSWINNIISQGDARYGIGGYDELRGMYAASPVFDPESAGEEPRRLHLGLDIWGKAGTPVMAPLEGKVHSFAINDAFGDYGGTIILEHVIEGVTLYTLFGHLSFSSLSGRRPGEIISKGNAFASFGETAENGHWPPHLHFQLIREIGEWKGDYPGVCKFSEREKWLQNSPDPDLIIVWR